MLVLDCEISIYSVYDKKTYIFNYVHNVSIESSWDQFTDTCTIQIPSNIAFEGKRVTTFSDEQGTGYEVIPITGLRGLFTTGDEITVKTGYLPNLTQVFKGFITKITPNDIITFECQDEMWMLKKEVVTKELNDTSLKNLFEKVFKGKVEYELGVEYESLGSFRFSKASLSSILERLKDDFGIYSFFRDGILRVGLPYYVNEAKTHIFHFQQNIIENQLEWKDTTESGLGATAISIITKNGVDDKIEVKVGDKDGDQITLHFFGITKESDLEKIATSQLEKYRYKGYTGYFQTFGEPNVRHGDFVKLKDDKLKDRNNTTYVVKSVMTFFGVDGYRQEIELSYRIA